MSDDSEWLRERADDMSVNERWQEEEPARLRDIADRLEALEALMVELERIHADGRVALDEPTDAGYLRTSAAQARALAGGATDADETMAAQLVEDAERREGIARRLEALERVDDDAPKGF